MFILFNGITILKAQTNYYVSNQGDDTADGLTPATAWQTIDHINNQTFLPGDSVFFEAGGVWRDELMINESGEPGNYITYTRYGTGKNPIILGSEVAIDWSATGTPNVWESATELDNYSDEYYPGRIFFIKDDSVSWGRYVEYDGSLDVLTQEYDYTISASTYYVYASSNPNTRYDSIEVNQRESCIFNPDQQPQSYLEINGIDFKFSRIWGYNAGYPAIKGATDLVFRNCTVGYIGARPSGAAYGISVWHSNLLVENCYISDCGRRGISVNLYLSQSAGDARKLENIIVRNNIFKRGYHTTSLDLSSQLTNTDTIQNVYFYNNIVDDSDFGEICANCGSNQVFFQDGPGVTYINNIYVGSNIFIQATARNILVEGGDSVFIWNNTIVGHNPNITENPYGNVSLNYPEQTDYRNNILYDNLPDNDLQNHGVLVFYEGSYFTEKDYNLYYSLFPKTDRNYSAHRVNNDGGMGYWNTNDWSDYISENTLFEQNSPLPQDPKFLNYGNKSYQLTDSSAAKAAGTYLTKTITDPFGNVDTIGKYDITGKPRIVDHPSIGAHEYQDPDSSAADIIYFVMKEQKYPAVINIDDHTISIDAVYGTDVSNLSPVITTSYGATVDPGSGVHRNFSSSQIYTVTSLNGNEIQEWTVSVNIAESSEANILGFSFTEESAPAVIDDETNVVNISVVPLTDISSLISDITLSDHAVVSPLSGEALDFSSPVQYTVTAQDGTEKVWTVFVNIELSTETDILEFSIPEQTVTASIDEAGHYITLEVENNADITSLTPSIKISEKATIKPESGVSRDFTIPVYYIVTAEDENTEQIWIINVTKKNSTNLNTVDKLYNNIVFPNPVKENFYIKSEKNAIIRISTLSGDVIFEKTGSGKITGIENRFSPGIYLITVYNTKDVVTAKLVVQ